MGGCCCCCCCAPKTPEFDSAPAYFCYPVSEERELLTSHRSTISTISTGFLVDTNLDTSSPDTYRPPPAPLPYEAYVAHPPTVSPGQEHSENRAEVNLGSTNTELAEDRNSVGTLETRIKNLDSDDKLETDNELLASNEVENISFEELEKSSEPFVPPLQNEEDMCPTCLEEYDAENPKIITKCDHHFHLACILEWMERSDTCPVCDQEMVFSPVTQG